eukprot:535733_1
MKEIRWFNLIGNTIATIICLFIWNKNRNKAKQWKVDTNQVRNKYQLRLNGLSSIIFIPITCIPITHCIRHLPFICQFGPQIALACGTSTRSFITFYQIARLEYTFLSSQIHSTKYGYPHWVFITLYLYGIVFSLHVWVIVWFLYSVKLTVSNYCISTITPFGIYFFLFGTIFYYPWDLIVLLLYIIKICTIKSKKYSINSNEQNVTDQRMIKVIKRINYILTKIIILTILYELFSFTVQIIIVFIPPNSSMILLMIRELVLMSDAICSGIVIFLMIEHNNEQYLNLLRILNKLQLCCCFDTAIDDKEEKNVTTQIKNSAHDNKNEITVDTKTINPVQMTHIGVENSVASVSS